MHWSRTVIHDILESGVVMGNPRASRLLSQYSPFSLKNYLLPIYFVISFNVGLQLNGFHTKFAV